MKACSVPGCGRRYVAKGYCSGHYQRWKYGSDVRDPVREYQYYDGVCSVGDCARPQRKRGYCTTHASRLQRTGDACEDVPIRVYSIHDVVGERAAHERAKRLWGPASVYQCVQCGGQAAEWAYDGTDPDQLYGPSGTSKVFYSLYPEFYMPMCKKCHKGRDAAVASRELQEYRSLKHETGLSHEEIRAFLERALN
jgi:hypothetical protein